MRMLFSPSPHKGNGPFLKSVLFISIFVLPLAAPSAVRAQAVTSSTSLTVDDAMRRLMEVFGPCDVASVAHLHNPHTTMRHLMGQYRVMVRSGSVKIWDSYGQQGGFGKGKPGMPVVIFYPNEHRMMNFTHLRDGVEVLNALRR